MKIKVEKGRPVRLQTRKTKGKRQVQAARWTSTKGGIYDLAKLKVPEDEWPRILKVKGVTEVKAAKKKEG